MRQKVQKTVRLHGKALEAALEIRQIADDFDRRQREIGENYDKEIKDLQTVSQARHDQAWKTLYEEFDISPEGSYACQTDAVADLGFGFLIVYETEADAAMREKIETGATEQ